MMCGFNSCIVQFQTNTKKVEQSTSDPRMNEKITAKFVRLVLDEGNVFYKWLKIFDFMLMHFVSGV